MLSGINFHIGACTLDNELLLTPTNMNAICSIAPAALVEYRGLGNFLIYHYK